MKILEKLKMTVESMNATAKNESDDFSSLFEKYNSIPAEDLNNIILDVKNICLKQNEDANKDAEDDIEEEVLLESEESDTDVKHANKPKDATHTDANKAESMQTNELDASENSYDVVEEPQEMTEEDEDIIVDEEPQEMTEEDEDEEELIISEEDEDLIVDEEPQEMAEEDEEDFDVYKDELDIVDEEDEDIIVDEEPQEMTEEDEDEEELIISEEDEDEEDDYKNEDNIGAKAAVANRQAKNNFSPDVDDLTKYLDNY